MSPEAGLRYEAAACLTQANFIRWLKKGFDEPVCELPNRTWEGNLALKIKWHRSPAWHPAPDEATN